MRVFRFEGDGADSKLRAGPQSKLPGAASGRAPTHLPENPLQAGDAHVRSVTNPPLADPAATVGALVDEVLQAHTIFANVDKGILAKSEDLKAAFGTDNEDEICVQIVDKGEFQVSEQERQMQTATLLKEIVNRVSDLCVNPENQLPYPPTTIERALKE